MFGIDKVEICIYLFSSNLIINILISLLNKDFRNGNHFGQILQLRILGYIPWLIVPFFLFSRVLKSLVKNEKDQVRNEKMKKEVRRRILKSKKRKK